MCVSVGDAWLCGWGSLRIGLRHVRRAIHSQWVPVVPGNRMTCALSLCVLSFVALGVEICLTLEAWSHSVATVRHAVTNQSRMGGPTGVMQRAAVGGL